MPKGGARQGAGRPRKPLADHWLRGTHRADRHGPLPKNVIPMRTTAPEDWQPSPEQIDVLEDSGRGFVAQLLERFTFNAAEGVILIEAAHAVDALAALRGLSMADKTIGEINTIQRLEQGWSRLLASHMAQLWVTHETTT
jgi:hypothetical protein